MRKYKEFCPSIKILVNCRTDGKLGAFYFNFILFYFLLLSVLLTKGHLPHTNACECSFGFHSVTNVLHVAGTVVLQIRIPEGKSALAL